MIKKLLNILGMNTIVINGNRTEVSGRNIVVRNGRVTVNGVLVADNLVGDVNIKFEGDLASLDATQVEVHGNVQGDVDGTNITINGNVGGDVDGTTINARDIGGDVDGTNVKANVVHGSVDAVNLNTRG